MAVEVSAVVRPTFFDSVERWADQDFGEGLRSFLHEISYADLITYAQLIHHKNAIVRSLLRHLADRSLSLAAFFDFSSAISTDLRDDFHPHFWPIFDAITNLFLTNKGRRSFSVVDLDGAFCALGQIVRTNFRFVVTQLKQLFSRLLPLLAFPSDDRLPSLCAQTFSFIFLKSPSPHKLAKFLLVKCFSDHGHLRDGLSLFFFDSLLCVGENAANLEELVNAMVGPIFEIPFDSELRPFSVSFLSGVFQKCLSCEKWLVSTQIVTNLLNRFENGQNECELQTVNEWLLVWINGKKQSQMSEENKRKLFSLLVTKIENQQLSSDCVNLFEQYLQLFSSLLLSLPPSFGQQSFALTVLSKFGSDLRRLSPLLRCLARLRPLPFFFTSVMELVASVASALLASTPTDFSNMSQEQVHLLRELLTFYKNIFAHLSNEKSMSSLCQKSSPPFCPRALLPIRHFVVAVLHNPSAYPSDFFDLTLIIWPHLWLGNEKAEGHDALNAFVVQSIRKGTERTLSEKETERLWNATLATRIVEQI